MYNNINLYHKISITMISNYNYQEYGVNNKKINMIKIIYYNSIKLTNQKKQIRGNGLIMSKHGQINIYNLNSIYNKTINIHKNKNPCNYFNGMNINNNKK